MIYVIKRGKIMQEKNIGNKRKRRGIWETAMAYTVSAIIGAETIGNNYAIGGGFPPADTLACTEQRQVHGTRCIFPESSRGFPQKGP